LQAARYLIRTLNEINSIHTHTHTHIMREGYGSFIPLAPQVYEIPLHDHKVGVWCAVSRLKIVWPVFFEETKIFQLFPTLFLKELREKERSVTSRKRVRRPIEHLSRWLRVQTSGI
jgi:hypothetical protein